MDQPVSAEPIRVSVSTPADQRLESLPLAHLSIEVGHLYMEDFQAGEGRIRQLFDGIAPWVAVAEAACRRSTGQNARVSTCFLIDDYFTRFSSPREVIPMVLRSAADAGVRVDYVARESACARAGDVALAELVVAMLVADPPPGTDGSRPTPHESGWLCNGVRSPAAVDMAAMEPASPWQPPSENGAHRHSVFVDVELWRTESGGRLWSCPFLAAVWQLLRLGVLRDEGRTVALPEPAGPEFPDLWDQLGTLTRVDPVAAPFAAYRTFSVLDNRFLPIEHAVRTILGQVGVDDAVHRQISQRAEAEGVDLDPSLVSRIEYAFAGRPWRAHRERAGAARRLHDAQEHPIT